MADWLLPGATRDPQSVTSDWKLVGQELIEGVRMHEIRNVIRATRTLTEIWRADWKLDDEPVDQVFQVELEPGSVSAWHAHAETTDRLFVARGHAQLVLYDTRPESSTCGRINEFHLSDRRPLLLVVPPRIWHGLANRGERPALMLNLTDRAYSYEAPDHWRVPPDSPHIPYSFD
jgi:dTDP-4-dehydrorhamnose 3,5-epimerase